MVALEILPDLFFIERGFLNGNHFVYRAEQPILIDTGYLTDFAETERLITSVGVDLAKTKLIINTHSHCDHIGGNRIIQDHSGCDIAVHRIGKYFNDMRDEWSLWRSYYHQEGEFFDGTISLEDGDQIEVGPYRFEVIYAPGHASDGIVLYHQANRLLITGDVLWENDLPAINIRIEGSRALFHAKESLDRLKFLDVAIIYPGHGPPFTDFAGSIAKVEAKIQRHLANPQKFAHAMLKRMFINTLLMHNGKIRSDNFFDFLRQLKWFDAEIDFYFDGKYQERYQLIMDEFLQRGLVKVVEGRLVTTVKA